MKSGHPSLELVKGCKSYDQGSVLLLPMMIAFTPCSSINRPTSRLKSDEKSWTCMPYLTKRDSCWVNRRDNLTYNSSICARNCSIYSNSFAFTKWTNLTRFNSSTYWSTAASACSDDEFSSMRAHTARSRCKTTVQSLPPLKLKAIYSGLMHTKIPVLARTGADTFDEIIEQTATDQLIGSGTITGCILHPTLTGTLWRPCG